MPKKKTTATVKIPKQPKTKLGNKKVEIDGVLFDSKLESEYYLELKRLQQNKKIHHFELQPEYVLIDAFTKNGKKYRKMTYTADFKVYTDENSFYLVDTKGFETEVFKLKEKLFNYLYQDIPLLIINYCKNAGAWMELSEIKKLNKKKKAK